MLARLDRLAVAEDTTTLQVALQEGRIPTDLEERQSLAVQIAQRQRTLRRARATNSVTIAVVIVVEIVSNSAGGPSTRVKR